MTPQLNLVGAPTVRSALVCVLVVLMMQGGSMRPAWAQAQPGLEEILGNVGTETAVVEAVDEGLIRGRVFDASSGDPLDRVTVILKWPAPGGTEGRQEVAITDTDGNFSFESVPAGTYDISFIKGGFRNATMTAFQVIAEQVNRADFPLPPIQQGEGDEVILLDEFVVEAETAAELVTTLETRLESDQLLNILSADDLSKFAAGDVAEALQRVAGVNIVEGSFAVIRGLEDRYSSTLYNGAPVPSPDPDRQSPQLDLFPSDIVANLLVSKTFSSESPSNSAGGSIDIITHQFPEEFTFKLKAGSGWAANAEDRFIAFDGRTDVDRLLDGIDIGVDATEFLGVRRFNETLDALRLEGFRPVGGSPIGLEDFKAGNFNDNVEEVLESDYQALIGGTFDIEGRAFRFLALAAREKDYSTDIGTFENLFARDGALDSFRDPLTFEVVPGDPLRTPDLSLGRLSLSEGRFGQTLSTFEIQTTYYGSASLDLDDEGNHRVDASVFFTEKSEETIDFREGGFVPGVDYGEVTQRFLDENLRTVVTNNPLFEPFVPPTGSIVARWRDEPNDTIGRNGVAPFAAIFESSSFQIDRKLQIYQLNGYHNFTQLPDFNFSWATNWGKTSQREVSIAIPYAFEPCGFNRTSTTPCPLGTLDAVPGFTGTQAIDPRTLFPEPGTAEMPSTGITSAPAFADLGPGFFIARNDILVTANRIEETSRFLRLDADYTFDFHEDSQFEVAGGLWWERADREVDALSLFNSSPRSNEFCPSTSTEFSCITEDPSTLGFAVVDNLIIDPLTGRLSNAEIVRNESKRKIYAWHVRGKLTLWESLDFLGGLRRERIEITSFNDPFRRDSDGEILFNLGGPSTFPGRFLLFDRLDEFSESRGAAEGTVFNDQILGLDVPEGECLEALTVFASCVNISDVATLNTLLNGEIKERRNLPFGGITFRNPFPFLEGLVIRLGYSRSVARPSFRELGYYVSAEPGSDDLVIGNPQLKLSDVDELGCARRVQLGRVR